ncbi:hypothetical protein D3C74_296120 [compost metagenome]
MVKFMSSPNTTVLRDCRSCRLLHIALSFRPHITSFIGSHLDLRKIILIGAMVPGCVLLAVKYLIMYPVILCRRNPVIERECAG